MLWYSEQFYRDLDDARQSANVIVPLTLDFVRPRSVIDVGCGPGVWLSVFKEHGVEDIWGLDGHCINTQILQIPSERFTAFDLSKSFEMDRKFDLVVSIEVAEHLPAASASMFVDSLVRLGDIILFSAAIPFQGGTNHVNEQWQDYWADHFKNKGYVAIDCIRNKIWDVNVSKVKRIYAQNMLIYAKIAALERYPSLKSEVGMTRSEMLAIVHPKIYASKIASPPLETLSLSYVVSILPGLVKNAFQRRFDKGVTYFQNLLPFLRTRRSH